MTLYPLSWIKLSSFTPRVRQVSRARLSCLPLLELSGDLGVYILWDMWKFTLLEVRWDCGTCAFGSHEREWLPKKLPRLDRLPRREV